MDSITVQIFLRSDGDYDYQVWPHDLEASAMLSEEGSDEGADNGGVCTGNMGDAIGMAAEAALTVARAHFIDNVFNPEVCPSSLDENGEPMGEETAHKFDKDTDECNECGAFKSLEVEQ